MNRWKAVVYLDELVATLFGCALSSAGWGMLIGLAIASMQQHLHRTEPRWAANIAVVVAVVGMTMMIWGVQTAAERRKN